MDPSVIESLEASGTLFDGRWNNLLPLDGGGGSSEGLDPSNFTKDYDSLLELHTCLYRFKNYTMEAADESCDPVGSSTTEIYSVLNRYKVLHGYIALFVCIFGAIANGLIMLVLRRKEMRTPVNLMLFALAIADLLIMVEYIPFALHMYVLNEAPEEKYSYASAVFVLFHVHFTQILHTISIQLTLTMAIWRYAAIKCSNRSSTFCTFKKCYQVIAAAYICPLFFCILNYLSFQIARKTKYLTLGPRPFDDIDGNDSEKLKIFKTVCQFVDIHDCSVRKVDLYIVETSELVKEHPLLHTIHFWTFSVFIKLNSCFVLTFFMCWMIATLYKASRHHRMLEEKTAISMSPIVGKPPPQTGERLLLSPIKNNRLLCQEGANNNNARNGVVASPTRSIKFSPSTHHNHQSRMGTPEEEDDGPRAALLNGRNNTNREGVGTIVLSSSSAAQPPNTLNVVSSSPTGMDSRRTSGTDGSIASKDAKNGGRRFTNGFIRFPSLRRKSVDQGKSRSSRRTDRTTRMLIAVLLLFLITEFPQGIIHLYNGWYGAEFFRCKYNRSAEIWDILALINSAVNFILYCFMSKQFRTQFRVSFNLTFCFKKRKWITLPNCNNNATVSTTV